MSYFKDMLIKDIYLKLSLVFHVINQFCLLNLIIQLKMSSGNLSPDDIKKIIVALQFHAAKRKLKIMKLFKIRKNAMTQIQN